MYLICVGPGNLCRRKTKIVFFYVSALPHFKTIATDRLVLSPARRVCNLSKPIQETLDPLPVCVGVEGRGPAGFRIARGVELELDE